MLVPALMSKNDIFTIKKGRHNIPQQEAPKLLKEVETSTNKSDNVKNLLSRINKSENVPTESNNDSDGESSEDSDEESSEESVYGSCDERYYRSPTRSRANSFESYKYSDEDSSDSYISDNNNSVMRPIDRPGYVKS